uniref:Uncharacterized protein n=1 Tax=Syphacia muris TaxID=451379 RepID=A0A0N5ALP0_9BILA
MNTFWGRLSVRRPSLATRTLVNDAEDDENWPPETKNEVFEFFAKAAKVKGRRVNRHYGSERDLRHASSPAPEIVRQTRKLSTLHVSPRRHNPRFVKQHSTSQMLPLESCSTADQGEKLAVEGDQFLLSPNININSSSLSETSSRSHRSSETIYDSDIEVRLTYYLFENNLNAVLLVYNTFTCC